MIKRCPSTEKWHTSRYPFTQQVRLDPAPHGRDMKRKKRELTRIDLRLEPEEKDKIKQRSKDAGLTISEYVRRCSLNDHPKFLSDEDRKDMTQLRKELFTLIRIGNLYHEQKTEEFNSVIQKGKRFLSKLKKRL